MSFITNYRPNTFKDVLGQDAACKALEGALEKKRAQCFVLTGPSGVGKTTLARIAAQVAGCAKADIIEADAATYSGIDKMREINTVMQYRAVGGGPRVAIIDEAHGLSKNAWDSLLKATEEPKAGALWFFCTTNVTKVPNTMLTRGVKITLKAVPDKDIRNLLNRVADAEKLDISDDAIDAIVSASGGSPRQALTYLVLCADARSRKQANALIEREAESVPVLDLCRFLNKPGSINTLMQIIQSLKEENLEGIRIQVTNYFGKVASNAKSEDAFLNATDVLDAFSQPYNGSEGIGPLMLSIARSGVFR